VLEAPAKGGMYDMVKDTTGLTLQAKNEWVLM
jgi:hypothetical protein